MAISFKVKDYKCFASDEYQGFDQIRHINVLIGKNNSGKSKLLEALECFVKSGIQQYSDMSLQIGEPVEQEALLKVFRTDTSRGYIGEIFRNNLGNLYTNLADEYS